MKVFYINNKLAIFFVFVAILVFTKVSATAEQNNKNNKMLSNTELYCKQMRGIRAELIENTPEINYEYPIHLLADAHCFTEQENLYFAAIKQAQEQLGNPASWFDEKIAQAKKEVELECKNNKLSTKELAACKQNKYEAKKNKYEAQKITDTAKYLENRQKLAKKLFHACSASMLDKITLLPQAIQLPLAWYMPTNRSITDLSFENNNNNKDWLLNLQNRSYKEDLQEILQHECPAEMIYWVSVNQELDFVNLYKRK